MPKQKAKRRSLRKPSRQWFSSYFGIEQPQYELPFVDFDLRSDVPLYIDPYAITKDPTELAINCHNRIHSYFQTLIDVIRHGDRQALRHLVRGHLSEPQELHLGVSKTAQKGRGLGKEQEGQIVGALAKSEAARVGVIQSIQELELHIEGIGPDKVSDLVANIILGELAGYTEVTCRYYGVATRPCAVSGFWDPDKREWMGDYFNLPVKNSHNYILVPRRFIRREKDLINHREFYEKYVLEILERELIDARDSLVRTLKNGRIRVTKKSMKEDPRFKPTKEFISQFIVKNPEVMDQYRNELWERFEPADPSEFSGKAEEEDPTVNALLSSLEGIKPGRKEAHKYHNTIYQLVNFVFDLWLENFDIEYETNSGRARVDIMADNYAGGGLFAEFRAALHANSVPMECKNYAGDLGNSEFNQIAGRMGDRSSRLGMLFCRGVKNKKEMLAHLTDRWLRQHVMILLFDDEDVKALVAARLARDNRKLESIIRRKRREVEVGAVR